MMTIGVHKLKRDLKVSVCGPDVLPTGGPGHITLLIDDMNSYGWL